MKLSNLLLVEERGQYSLIAYLLVIIPVSFFFALVTDFGVKYIIDYRYSFEMADWVYNPTPRMLEGKKDELRNLIKEIVQKVKVERTDSLKTSFESANRIVPNANWSLFGDPSILVNTEKASYSKSNNKERSEVEEKIFSNFSDLMNKKAKRLDNHKGDPSHFEITLSKMLGLWNFNEDSIRNPVVPWIYIASRKEGICLYPGSAVIGEAEWQIKSRPWFKASLGGESKLSTGLRYTEGDMLTVTYLDVLAKSAILVRTYLYIFTDNGEDFVIGIDIHFPETSQGLKPSIYQFSLEEILTPTKWKVALVLMFFVFFIVLKRITETKSENLIFDRRSSGRDQRIGDEITQSITEKNENQASLNVDLLNMSLKNEYTRTKNKSQSKTIEITNYPIRDIRGIELWNIYLKKMSFWSFFGLKFEHTSQKVFGSAQLNFTREIIPEFSWIENKVFNDSLGIDIAKYLTQNSDVSEGFLNVSIKEITLSFLKTPTIPVGINKYLDGSRMFALKQCRAYVKLKSEDLKDLYNNYHVKAVMTSSYLEQLLNANQIDFLRYGITVNRVITFRNANSNLRLNEQGISILKKLFEYYEGESRLLFKSEITIEGGTPQPIYDYAILDDKVIFVAHSVYHQSVLDFVSGKPGPISYCIEGYFSWRSHDVNWYLERFGSMKKELFDPQRLFDSIQRLED
jgi:hypothetical protein